MSFQWNAGTVILYIIILIVIIIILQIISIKMKYKPMFDWWNNNGGASYNQNFNIFAVMASNDNLIFYYISSLLGTLNNQIDRPEISFLFEKIFPLTVTPDIHIITQFVLPRHITESISFKKGDNDMWFDRWLTTTSYDDNSFLTYSTNIVEPPKNDKGETVYNVTKYNRTADSRTGKIGVYPAPNDTTSWKYLFIEWGAKTWNIEKDSTLMVPALQPNEVTDWLDCASHPDNFLARYGILPDSVLIIAFIYGSYNDSRTGLKLDATAFKNLIGTSNPGGWIGYLNGIDNSSMTKDEYDNILYSKYAIDVNIPKPKVNPSNDCDVGSNTISSIGIGLGPVGIGAMGGPVGFGIGALIGIGLAIANGINTSSKCASKTTDDDKKNS